MPNPKIKRILAPLIESIELMIDSAPTVRNQLAPAFTTRSARSFFSTILVIEGCGAPLSPNPGLDIVPPEGKEILRGEVREILSTTRGGVKKIRAERRASVRHVNQRLRPRRNLSDFMRRDFRLGQHSNQVRS